MEGVFQAGDQLIHQGLAVGRSERVAGGGVAGGEPEEQVALPQEGLIAGADGRQVGGDGAGGEPCGQQIIAVGGQVGLKPAIPPADQPVDEFIQPVFVILAGVFRQ